MLVEVFGKCLDFIDYTLCGSRTIDIGFCASATFELGISSVLKSLQIFGNNRDVGSLLFTFHLLLV